jgi:hypothetical protein
MAASEGGGPIEVDDLRKRFIEETDRVAARLLETGHALYGESGD